MDYPEDWYELPYRERERLLRGQVCLYEREELSALLDREDRAYLRGLREFAVRDYPGLPVLFSHYAFPDLTGGRVFWARTVDDAAAHLGFMAQHGCALGVSGHDHFEGLRVFTTERVQDLPFGVVRLDHSPTWIHGPAVVNGTHANGVMVLETDTLELESIPLNSVKHQIPSWRGEWKG